MGGGGTGGIGGGNAPRDGPSRTGPARLPRVTPRSWLLNSGSNTLTLGILYGKLAEVTVTPVPLPAALVPFGSALAGFFSFSRLRERLFNRMPATARA